LGIDDRSELAEELASVSLNTTGSTRQHYAKNARASGKTESVLDRRRVPYCCHVTHRDDEQSVPTLRLKEIGKLSFVAARVIGRISDPTVLSRPVCGEGKFRSVADGQAVGSGVAVRQFNTRATIVNCRGKCAKL
jgi:hypothetical protein